MIHPTALVHKHTKIHTDAKIGPWCIVEEGVEIESGVVLEARVRVVSGTKIEKNTIVYDGAVLGAAPQDLKYKGEATALEIGERSEEHTRELQSRPHLVCRLLLEKKKNKTKRK